MAIGAGTSNLVWRRFCQVIGQPERAQDPQYATTAARRMRRDEIAGIIQQWTGARTKAEVVSTLTTAGVPAAPVNNVAEMVADPQVQAREMFVALDHPTYGPVTITGTPLKLSETPARVERLAPLPGEGAPLNWRPSAHAVAGGITRRFLVGCWDTPLTNWRSGMQRG